MIDISTVLKKYDTKNLTVAVLGGHSALDVCRGAKKYGFRTVAVCEKGREKTYAQYYKSKGGRGCVDEVILVDKFADVVKPEVQKKLLSMNAVFLQSRYFWVYCDFDAIENAFAVPIFGNRGYVRLEERDHPQNQYVLLEKAGIRTPQIIRKGGEVLTDNELQKRLSGHFKCGGPLIVKASEALRKYERAFFVITCTKDYYEMGERLVDSGTVTSEGLSSATIEEFIIGAQVNLNFFYSPLTGEVELMGTDSRRQTSLDGFLRLTAPVQTSLIDQGYKPSMVETGHYAVTMKESLVEKAYILAEKFVKVMKDECGREIIGPFALQGAVASEKGKEEFVIFDVSMRIPGSPGTAFTPYSGYLHGESLSFGERIGMELKKAVEEGKLSTLLT